MKTASSYLLLCVKEYDPLQLTENKNKYILMCQDDLAKHSFALARS